MSTYNSSYSGSQIDTAVGRLHDVNLGITTASKALTVDGSRNVVNVNDLVSTGTLSGSNAEFASITGSEFLLNGNASGSNLTVSSSALLIDGKELKSTLADLTTSEIGQLKKIDAKTISNTQWGYLGDANQAIDSASAATFTGMTYDGNSGSSLTIGSIAEEITVGTGAGLTGVDSSADLAPAGSLIEGVAFRVTQAPGGGATELNIARKTAGNIDEFISSQSCDVLGETGNAFEDNDGTQLPVVNSSADKLTITTDANVDTSDMKVRVVVFYKDLTAPTS